MADNTSISHRDQEFSQHFKHNVTKSPVTLRTPIQAMWGYCTQAEGHQSVHTPCKRYSWRLFRILLRMTVQILPVGPYWNILERFMGDTEVPICVFLLFLRLTPTVSQSQ